jgi:MYXO-CTERM domain-containing protein
VGIGVLTTGAMAEWHGPIVADFEGLDTPYETGSGFVYGFFASHAGLEWYCPEYIEDDQAGVYVPNGSNNGYTYGVTSGEQAFFSPFASSVEISLDGGGLWTMESVWVNAAWNDGMTFSFQGLREGQVVAEMEHVHAYATVVELITFGNAFIGIDTLFVDSWGGTDAGFDGSGDHYTMDDFTYSVPAPGAIALLGIAGLCTRRRRARC